MSNLVIVAIPDENDRVWKVSSEKVPHLTLLFLGDTVSDENYNQIVEFVGHASTMLDRFYLQVDRRGEIGEDKADALFFKKDRYSYRAIRDFRSVLLKNNAIRTAYDSATQFEGPWTPHLTLGYPETPAKNEDGEWGLYSVDFTKIAVWMADYEGPEFPIEDSWDKYETLDAIPMDVAMSSLNNIRVSSGMSALSHAEKVSDTKWSQFKNSDYTDEQYARACLLDRGENAGTAKERYGLPVREPDGTLNRNACHAAAAVLSSTGGTGSARGSTVKGTSEQLAKAKKKLVALYKGPLDEDVPKGLGGEDTMQQTFDLGAEFLKHYGVKGQKWGVRKEAVAGGPEGSHIRIGKSGRATTSIRSGATTAAVGILAFRSPRVRAEVAAAEAHNKQRRIDKKAVKADLKWEKKIYTTDSAVSVHNAMAEHFNERIGTINDKPKYKNLNLVERPDEPAAKEYEKEVHDLTMTGYREAVKSVHGSSPSGKKQAVLSEDGESIKIVDVNRKVRHAVEDDEDIEFLLRRDDNDLIVEMNMAEINSVAQTSAEIGAAFVLEHAMAQSVSDIGSAFVLEHFGVKGMRWGTRKAASAEAPVPVTPSAISRVPHGTKRKTKIKTEGGENHPAHEDAIKVAESRAKLRKSGTAALSNKELRDVANRLQLEQQVTNLAASRGKKFVRRQFENETSNLASQGIRKGTRKVFRFA